MKQRIFTLLLMAVCMTVSVQVYADSSGYCGSTANGADGHNLEWSYNSTTKTLTITGSGEMRNYSFYRQSEPVVLSDWGMTQEFYHEEFYHDIEHIILPYGLTHIGEWAFCGFKNITEIMIPSTVTSIGVYAFGNCPNLKTVYNCSTTENVLADAGIGKKIEYSGQLERVASVQRVVSSGVTSSDYTNFTLTVLDCGHFEDGNILYRITSTTDENTGTVEVVAKEGCYSGEIVIPATVAYGDLGVVYNVTEIDANAFSGCTGITSIKDNSGILTQTQIDAIVGGHSTEPSVGETFTEDGFTYRVKTITPSYTAEVITGRCPQTSSAVTIPSEVTCTQDGHSGTFTVVGIAAGAFKDCKTLSGIEIPNSVTEIADDAFEGCSGLNTVTDNTTEHILGDDISDWTADNNGVGGKFTVDGIEYEITNNTATPKTVKIVNACPATYSVVTLPNTVEHNGKTYSVTDIDGHAFDGCMNVEDIVDNSNDLLTDEQEQNVENGTGISGNGANTVSGLTIYHSGQGAVTSFAGGKVEGEIAYKRKITPNRWETICFPFNVEEIKMTRVGSSTEESIWPVYNNGGETKPGHFWMRTFDAQDAQVSAEQFQNNWQNITGTDKPLIEKNKPYIIQVPSTDKNGGVFNFADTYITFYGRLDANEMIPARIADADVHTVSTDGQFSYNANTTMMSQTVSNAYVMDNAGVSFVVGTEVKPFECYVLTNGATIQRIRSIGLNTPGYEETTGLIGADEVSSLVMWSNGNELFISSDHSQRIQVYSIDGRCVATVDVTGDVTANVTLNAGCYIVIGDGVRGKVVVK